MGRRHLYRGDHRRRLRCEASVTAVKRGDITFNVYARGEFQGGNSTNLQAPMAGATRHGHHLPAKSRRSGEERRRGGAVRHHRTGVQAARSRGRSGRGRAEGDPGAGADGGQARRGQLPVHQSPFRPEAGANRGAQESGDQPHRGEAERPGGGRRAGHARPVDARSGESQGDLAGRRRDSGCGGGQSESADRDREEQYRHA